MAEIWKKCSTCKKDIFCNQIHYICSVSTCRAKATNYVFCSVECWDAHLPVERHRGDTAAALERRAPKTAEPEPEREVKRIVVESNHAEDEILVVVSKVKKYIDAKSGMNTSGNVMDTLTNRIHRLLDRAIEEARRQGRKTVMDRDIP